MKICEFTRWQLDQTTANGFSPKTPMESAMQVLRAALETVNRAGLDGKELSDLRVV